MRMLDIWSDSSFSTTVPRPWKTEPSRRIAYALRLCRTLEVAGVDRLEARDVDRQLRQRAVGGHHRPSRIGADVAGRDQSVTVARPCHRGDARYRGEPRLEISP